MSNDKKKDSEVIAGGNAAGQHLTFKLDSDVFATDIRLIREVLEYTQVTKVPCSHESMQGVINLRGKAVPVIDLRLQFGIPSIEVTVDTCIIIIEVEINNKATVIGVLVDSVMEVVDLKEDQMEAAPEFGLRVNNDFIQGIARFGDGFVIVLDMSKTFSLEQLGNMQPFCDGEMVTEDAA